MQSQPRIRSGAPTSASMPSISPSKLATGSTPSATVRTMPSSMAQKKVRLSSSFTFWMERTWYCPPTRTTTGWEAKIIGVSGSPSSPTSRAYSRPAGSALISWTMRCCGSAPVTTILRSELTKCWVRKTVKGRVVVNSATTAALGWKAPSCRTKVRSKCRSSPAEAPNSGMSISALCSALTTVSSLIDSPSISSMAKLRASSPSGTGRDAIARSRRDSRDRAMAVLSAISKRSTWSTSAVTMEKSSLGKPTATIALVV